VPPYARGLSRITGAGCECAMPIPERRAGERRAEIGCHLPTLSRHLALLRLAGIVIGGGVR
jgi:hypothetical protein